MQLIYQSAHRCLAEEICLSTLVAPTGPVLELHLPLADTDPEVAAAIAAELRRQQTTLEMIASENFAPVAVMQAQGSVLTNKYAEGYPGRRYYGGCEHVDVIEQMTRLQARVTALAERHPLYPDLTEPDLTEVA